MVEKGIGAGMCLKIHRHTKVNDKYMKDYDTTKESSYLIYWDFNSLYG